MFFSLYCREVWRIWSQAQPHVTSNLLRKGPWFCWTSQLPRLHLFRLHHLLVSDSGSTIWAHSGGRGRRRREKVEVYLLDKGTAVVSVWGVRNRGPDLGLGRALRVVKCHFIGEYPNWKELLEVMDVGFFF